MNISNISTTNEGSSAIDYRLWSRNTPEQFWQTEIVLDALLWHEAIQKAVQECEFSFDSDDIDQVLFNALGEGRFGEDHWDLSAFNQFYWMVKPIVPKPLIRSIKGFVNKKKSMNLKFPWPIEDHFACFMWETMRQVLQISGKKSIKFRNFWPAQKRFSLVLTHDVETIQKQAFISVIADLEEKNGFRSSFNIVGEQIPKDLTLFKELNSRGFEIGIHGWKHNATAFQSWSSFLYAAKKINECLEKTGAVGMRFPLNLRHPMWMQDLNIEYDLSFFDTDPFEPIPGGAMSIWPFIIGRFMELPATLVQDNTLVNQLGEKTPRIWLEKIDFLKKYHGMALLNSHPDYLVKNSVWKVYEDFLKEMKDNDECWNGLPKKTARWWRFRANPDTSYEFPTSNLVEAILVDDQLEIIRAN